MHLLAKQLSALNRQDLIPHQLIAQFPAIADRIALRWGEAGLEDELLNWLVLDETQATAQIAHSPTVVRELMRLSVAYIDLMPHIIASRDVWNGVRSVADATENHGYMYSSLVKDDASVSTLVGYDWPASVMPQVAQDEWSPLMQAAFAGRLIRVRTLLDQGQGLMTVDSDGHQALHLAALQGHTSIVCALLDAGADLDALSHRGSTPLILAAAAGHLALVEILLELGAQVHHARKDGRTALHQAVAYGHDAIVVRLLQAGANPLQETLAGQTALSLVPVHKTRMAQLLECAIPKRNLSVLATRQIVSQPLIDWS
ncbi:ankyrin repeat domain-containing protein [Chitinibacter fontanus]|uniref:Ankyrin repeat domain-containing protein n=1 Tax=Chitinibacter fontanus TaxID=1737446 RepID=A0A7D5V8R1_9NEIS|nr:ankyrin repeat domain-containing protein [Chitinibacter fontanus]QLI80440.1 ankyrin repeat domain-containing protein [Chitinibacter fontanus]